MQSPESLRWDDLRMFLAVHRGGSLSQAAASLGVNVSTASRRLEALEESLGIALFNRTPDGTRPTFAAEQLLPHAEAMEQTAVALTRTLEGLEAEPSGEVRVTAPPGFADQFLAPAMVDLVDRYPKLRVTLLATVSYADLARREADIALRIQRPEAGDFVVRRVASHPMRVIGAPALVASLGRLRHPNAVRWVSWAESLAGLPDARWVAEHVAPERVVLRTIGLTAQIEAVRAGLGVMLAAVPYASLPGLVEVPCGPKLQRTIEAIGASSLWMVGHRSLHDVPRIAAVWAWLERRFER